MTRSEVLAHLCATVGTVYHSIGDYSKASDGFCDECVSNKPTMCFNHEGVTLEYVRLAVIAKLEADGHKVKRCF